MELYKPEVVIQLYLQYIYQPNSIHTTDMDLKTMILPVSMRSYICILVYICLKLYFYGQICLSGNLVSNSY